MSDLEKKWLIRSSANTILGPYTKEEIGDLLKESVLSLHDEVTGPRSFWRGLKNHPEFKEVTSALRAHKSLGRLMTSISGKLTASLSSTDLSNQKTQTLTEKNETNKMESADLKPAPDKRAPNETFQKKEKQRPPRRKTYTGLGGILIVAGLTGYIVFKEFLQDRLHKQTVERDLRADALSAYRSGDYEEALRLFEEGLRANQLGTEERILTAALLLKKNKADTAESLLRAIPEEEQTGGGFFLIKGLVSMHERNFSEGEKYLLRAKSSDPEKSLLNLSVLKFLQKDHTASLKFIDELRGFGYKRGLILYLKTLNQMSLFPSSNERPPIKSRVKKTPEYHQEFYLLTAYLSALDGNLKETEKWIKKTLSEDPYFSEEYLYSPFIAHKLPDWSFLTSYCNQIFKKDPGNPFFSALLGFCLLKAGQRERGAPYMERAKKQSDHPIILSAYSFHLMEGGRLTKAEETLEMILENNERNEVIPHILQGRLYERRGRWSAAVQAYKNALSLNAIHITGLAGAAFAGYQLGRDRDMKHYRDRGLEIYPHHSRLLILKSPVLKKP